MKYIAFFFSLTFSLLVAVGLSINLASLPPLASIFDPFKGFWQNAYSEDRNPEASIFLEGLSQPVEVVFDDNLIPHIFAESEKDLYKVQGYVTAAHRLWQMEFQVLAAEGRLSEIVGEMALPRDREMRRKGLGFGARNKLKYLQEEDPETLAMIQAYADGVNAYIRGLSAAQLPIEYKLLDYRPEPWSPYKSLVFLMNMAEILSGDQDFAYTNTRNLFGDSWIENLFPETPADLVPVVAHEQWDFTPEEVIRPDVSYPDSGFYEQVLPGKEPGYGSNNWAVSGDKTASGFPILANDPHLALNLPSLWYAIQLSTPEYTVKGASLPGAVGVISGFNENIAWGITNADRDVKDWYKIKFRDDSRAEYLYNGQWIKSNMQLDTIRVKGRNDFIDTVVYTHYGPVVYDRNFLLEGKPVDFALKWTAHDPSNEQRTFLDLNRAGNYQEYLEAISHFAAPAQNFAFASREGDIAMTIQGKFPLKWPGQGKYLMDGSKSAFEWQGFIPNAHNAREINPEKGFVTSANQHPVSPNYPYYVFSDQYEYYRNRRIHQQLSEGEEISTSDMMQLQLDNYDLHAAETLPYLLDNLDSTWQRGAGGQWVRELEDWDYFADADQAGPALFQSWWQHLQQSLFDSWETNGLPIVYPSKYSLSRLLQDEPLGRWFDDPATTAKETAAHWVSKGFEGMSQEMDTFLSTNDSLTWAGYKNTRLDHLIPNLTPFGKDARVGGGKNIVNASSSDWGPGWRMVVALGPEIKAFGIYPGGQSGNPGSKFYHNMVSKWKNGDYISIDLRARTGDDNVLFTTTFNPD
ncbi:penicillin acylase family protein [Cyclobacterium sp. SYSU L10401]|uniref:penicillin acylase family protein n=1 Tax=Cyclobacterium sp. SYSU L10401 TaxID=2678657 RepID=UPI0013D3EF0D|nr:penicillin acylase family protein [Cyclobacterium sp. SYSU L10401]